VLPTFTDENVLLGTWRGLLGVQGAANAFALKFGRQEVAKSLPPPVLAAAVRAAREAGKPGAKLLAALAPLAGTPVGGEVSTDYMGLAAQTKQNGDPAKGELVYRRATSACVTCHAIGGAGGKVGPDMTSIGASAPLDYLIESILAPAAKVKEGYNGVTLTLLDGEQVTGVQSRESANELFVRDAAGNEKGVPKAQIKSKADIGSMMPPGLTAMLKPREALDMYAFLSELGKPGPYDASKGSVARVWRMYPATAAGEVVSAAYDPAKNPGFPGYTLVDGRFVKDLLTEATMIAAGGADTVLLATQFQSSGKTRLKLTGTTEAWLDGQPLALTGEVAPELANGTHTLVVKVAVKALPEVLRAESPDARFLGN
jgi:putative heme-binding domain-containing protein